MTILGIHHVQITIPKGAEEQGRQFYCHLLGLTEIEKPEVLQTRGGFWLQIGDKQVHVGTENGVKREDTKAHIAYQVSDIDALRIRLQESSVPIQDDVPLPGLARFQIRDPFGNRIEFIQTV
jgi:catechol 2,3-dioxygenase-like lactoylglutathione lyase family enzyme